MPTDRRIHLQPLVLTAAFAALLALVWFCYRPGLSGTFLFDDYANLPALGATGPIDNGPALWRYLTSGVNDPIGRPITVASFLLDAQNWPADPRPFKRTNLLIHLLNLTLLAWLLLALGRRAGLVEAHAQRAALLGAAIWGLHPLFVSTTLYVVQREAMLPATFVMSGLLLWLAGHTRLAEGRIASGLLLEIAGLGSGTLLATLAKANGALLPIFALLIEYVLLRPRDERPPSRWHSRLLAVLAWLPALAILAYLAWTAARLLGGPPPFGRTWTEGQRLLTEPRVLWSYLRLLWLPRPFTPGLFNDQIQASTSLFHPWTTLPALLGVIALIAGAWGWRRRAPLWALAILFYFAGQLIESTAIPLELYFEHRNYLPALLLFWPLAVWVMGPRMASASGTRSSPERPAKDWPGRDRIEAISVTPRMAGTETCKVALLKGLAAALIIAVLAILTHSRAQLWGNTAEQALMWARLNPDSPRAQSYAAQVLMKNGHATQAVAVLRPLLTKNPDQIQIAFNLIGADCVLGAVPEADIRATAHALRTTPRLGDLPYHWLASTIAQAHRGECRGLTPATVERWIDAAQANPLARQSPGWQQDLLSLRGRAALANGDARRALTNFVAALHENPTPDAALEQAALLASFGHPHEALAELDAYRGLEVKTPPPSAGMPWLHAWVLRRQRYWPHEFAHLRAAIEADARSANRKQ